MKKIISIVLAVFMLTTIFAAAVAVNAAEGKMQIVVDTVEANPGDTVDVKIDLKDVTDLASIMAVVTWDAKLTLVDAVYNCNFKKNGTEKSGSMTNVPDDTKTVVIDGEEEEVPDWSTASNPFSFNWVGLKAANAIKEDVAFVTLTFEVSETAEIGEVLAVTADIDPENVFDSDDANVAFELTNGGVKIKEPEPQFNGKSIDNFKVGDEEVKDADEAVMEVGTKITALGWASFKDGLKEVYWTVDGTKQACEDNYRDRADVAAAVPGTYNNGEHAGFGKDDKYIDLTGTDALEAGVYSLAFVAVSNSGEEQVLKNLSLTVKEKPLAIIVGDAEVKAGETVDVTISLENVKAVASVRVVVEWPEELELQKAEYKAPAGSGIFTHEPEELDAEENPVWTGITGSYVFNWLATDADKQLTADTAFVVLTFKAADDAETGDYEVKATVSDADDIFFIDKDEEEVNVDYTVTDGTVKITAKEAEPEEPAITQNHDDENRKTDDGKQFVRGWVGANYKIAKIGYKVDGGEPIFGDEMELTTPEDAVIGVAGPYGMRFTANIDLTKLAEGEHTIELVVQVEDPDNTILVFDTLTVEGQASAGTDTDAPDNPPTPPTADAAIIAVSAVAVVALAGAFIGKNALKKKDN